MGITCHPSPPLDAIDASIALAKSACNRALPGLGGGEGAAAVVVVVSLVLLVSLVVVGEAEGGETGVVVVAVVVVLSCFVFACVFACVLDIFFFFSSCRRNFFNLFLSCFAERRVCRASSSLFRASSSSSSFSWRWRVSSSSCSLEP